MTTAVDEDAGDPTEETCEPVVEILARHEYYRDGHRAESWKQAPERRRRVYRNRVRHYAEALGDSAIVEWGLGLPGAAEPDRWYAEDEWHNAENLARSASVATGAVVFRRFKTGWIKENPE